MNFNIGNKKLDKTLHFTIACKNDSTFFYLRDTICKDCLVRTKCLYIGKYASEVAGGMVFTKTPCMQIVSELNNFDREVSKNLRLIWF